jgi:hypothetical protein
MKKFSETKNKILYIFLIDILFFTLLSTLLLYSRKKISFYITMLMGYAQQVSEVAQQTSISNLPLEQIQYLTSSIAPLTLKIKLHIYLIFPLLLYLIWSITQSIDFALIKDKSIVKEMLKHLTINLPLFGLLLLLTELLFRQLTSSVNGLTITLIILVMVFITYYYNILYSLKQRFPFKKAFKLSVSKFTRLFPLYLVNMIIFLFSFIFLWNILIKIVSSQGGYLLSTIFLMISIFCWSSYKLFLVRKIQLLDKR